MTYELPTCLDLDLGPDLKLDLEAASLEVSAWHRPLRGPIDIESLLPEKPSVIRKTGAEIIAELAGPTGRLSRKKPSEQDAAKSVGDWLASKSRDEDYLTGPLVPSWLDDWSREHISDATRRIAEAGLAGTSVHMDSYVRGDTTAWYERYERYVGMPIARQEIGDPDEDEFGPVLETEAFDETDDSAWLS